MCYIYGGQIGQVDLISEFEKYRIVIFKWQLIIIELFTF